MAKMQSQFYQYQNYINNIITLITMHTPNCCDRQRKCLIPYCKTHQINPHQFHLTQKGIHQSARNSSCNIWSAFDWGDNCQIDYYSNPLVFKSMNTTAADISDNLKDGNSKLLNLSTDKAKNQVLQNENQLSRRRNVSFDLKQNQGSARDSGKVNNKINNNVNFKNLNNSNDQSKQKNMKISINNYLTKKSPEKQAKLTIPKKQLTQEQKAKRQIFLKECYSIDKYLKSNTANTRTLPNSAIKLFYERPCLQAYGRGNKSKKDGFIYNDFMKTHNVNPHRLGNEPKKYQTYRSALNFLKRTKFDPQQRWRKIHRQMRSRLNMKQLVQYFAQGVIDVTAKTLQQTLKISINNLTGTAFKRSKSLGNLIQIPDVNKIDTKGRQDKFDFNTTRATNDTKEQSQYMKSLKRSKSWGKKQYLFLYKYTNKDGQTHYCKDRHGITCYVDPTFEQNKQAFLNFQRKVNPIQGEDVDPSDRNLDQIILQNYAISKQQDIPKHYLLPNCSQPYKAQKFSYKARKKNSARNQQGIQA